jgi:hypothetical protein
MSTFDIKHRICAFALLFKAQCKEYMGSGSAPRSISFAALAVLTLACAQFALGPTSSSSPLPLRVAVVASWSSSRNTLAHLWLLSRVFEAATGRPLEPVQPEWLPDFLQVWLADVVLFGPYGLAADSRETAKRLRARGTLTLFFASESWIGDAHGFSDMMVNDVDISFGHRRDILDANYLRLPWWLPDVLDPSAAKGALSILPALLEPGPDPEAWRARSGFAALLSSHTSFPRPELFALMTSLGGFVSAPGRAFHNCDWPAGLPTQGNTPNEGNGKVTYLSGVRFNICPENSRYRGGGYTTEKLVHALLAGTVPIYWGDAVEADAAFFNFRRVIVFDGESNASVVEQVRRLDDEAAFRAAWFARPKLNQNAQVWVDDWAAKAINVVAAAFAASQLA